jgi:hypothetical protein
MPEDPYEGEGSQTPPAHDRDGVQVPIPGVFTPEEVERVASKWMRKQAFGSGGRWVAPDKVAAWNNALGWLEVHDFTNNDRSVIAYDQRNRKYVFPATEVELVWPTERRHPSSKGRAKAAIQWTPERRLVDALLKGDQLAQQLDWLLREEPRLRPHLTKAKKHTDIAVQILERDVSRELSLPSSRYASMKRTAGEVRFIKDRGGDKNEWGWGSPGPTEREIGKKFTFRPTKIKPLATTLRASLMALGHAMSAYAKFAKIKSATVSPDGSLGGKGYITKISDMRRQYMNVIEALSALTDTLYDEINAPHWNPAEEEQDPREREQVRDIMEDVEEIRSNPEDFAEEEEAEMDAENAKEASRRKVAALRAEQDLTYVNDLAQVRVRRVAQEHLAKTQER